eukprot:m51a1_g7416 hypothetical protein (493) ;mRNA; f:222441-223987
MGVCECIAGFEGDAANSTGCQACRPGYYKSSAGNGACTLCPEHSGNNHSAGEYCACDAGYGGDAMGPAGCRACVTAKETPGNYMCPCDHRSEELDGVCVCRRGYYGDGDARNCTLCPGGTFKNVTGDSTGCLACPDHSGHALLGQVDATACRCLAGFGGNASEPQGCLPCLLSVKEKAGNGRCLCVNGSVPDPSSLSTCLCAAGHQPNANATACLSCPVGTFKGDAGNTECASCGAGKTTPSAGKTSYWDCRCVPGTQPSGRTFCAPCLQGWYREGVEDLACSQCPDGSNTAREGSASATDCKCVAGRQRNATTGLCDACPLGFFKEELGDEPCTRCPDGRTTQGEGSTSSAACTAAVRSSSSSASLSSFFWSLWIEWPVVELGHRLAVLVLVLAVVFVSVLFFIVFGKLDAELCEQCWRTLVVVFVIGESRKLVALRRICKLLVLWRDKLFKLRVVRRRELAAQLPCELLVELSPGVAAVLLLGVLQQFPS